MKHSILLFAALAGVLTANGMAAATLREVHVTPLAAPDSGVHIAADRRITADSLDAQAVTNATPSDPSPLAVLPVAGISSRDYAIPFFVDLQPGPGILDFNCTRLTFDTHTGHDPYIRSFREQQIGVPVFAIRDGVVVDMRDGEPDENTDSTNTALRSNYVYLRHSDTERSQYVHLKRNSVTVAIGDFVPAGTQIGMIGSSGPSAAPHIHFETTIDGQPVEPMAGPCRPGLSAIPHQEQQLTADTPIAYGATFSKLSFGSFRQPPFDDAPHTGTFLSGHQILYFKAELANVGASTNYQLKLDPPGTFGNLIAAAGTLVNYDASLVSVWWGIDVNLNQTGTWAIHLTADGKELLNAPFTVVDNVAADVNRAPSPYSVSFDAPVIVPGRVPVCRVNNPIFGDPDYDVLTYRYRWMVNNEVVRDVSSAVRTDALARDKVRAGTTLTCSVTISDGKVETQPVSAFASIETGRRRAVTK
jgi:hypothetical protein